MVCVILAWLKSSPAFYTILGAALGYFGSWLRDFLGAQRSKKFFLHVIGVELDRFKTELNAWSVEVQEASARMNRETGQCSHFSARLRTAAFAIQVQKLRDVEDDLTIDVIHFYSDLALLELCVDAVNLASDEYGRAITAEAKNDAWGHVESSMRALRERIQGASGQLRDLRPRLPPA